MPVSTTRKPKKAAAKKPVSRKSAGRKSVSRKTVSRKTAPRKSARKKETIHVVLDDKSVVSPRHPRARSFASLRASTVNGTVNAAVSGGVAKQPKSASRWRWAGAAEPALPSWKDLDRSTNGRVVAPKSHPFDSISTLKIAGLILGAGIVVTAYVGHVQATQDVLSDLQTLRAEGASLRLELNSIRGEYDRLTGPAEIRHAAHDLGLIDNTTFAEPIIVND